MIGGIYPGQSYPGQGYPGDQSAPVVTVSTALVTSIDASRVRGITAGVVRTVATAHVGGLRFDPVVFDPSIFDDFPAVEPVRTVH